MRQTSAVTNVATTGQTAMNEIKALKEELKSTNANFRVHTKFTKAQARARAQAEKALHREHKAAIREEEKQTKQYEKEISKLEKQITKREAKTS